MKKSKIVVCLIIFIITKNIIASQFTENNASDTPFYSATLKSIITDDKSPHIAVELIYKHRDRVEDVDNMRIKASIKTKEQKICIPLKNFLEKKTTLIYNPINTFNNDQTVYELQNIQKPIPSITAQLIDKSIQSFSQSIQTFPAPLIHEYNILTNNYLFTILAQYQALQSKTEGLYQELSEMQLQVNAQTEFHQLRYKSQQLKEICKESEKKLQKANEKHQEIEEAYFILSEVNTKLQQDVSNKEHTLICIKNSKDLLEEKKEKLNETLKKLETTLEESNQKLIKLKEKIKLQNKADLSQQIIQLTAQITEKEEEFILITQEKQKLESELKQADNNTEKALTEQKKELQKEINSLTETIKKLEKEQKIESKKVDESLKKIEYLNQNLKREEEKRKELLATKELALQKVQEELKKQKIIQEEELAIKAHELTQLQKQKEELENKLIILQNTKNEIEKNLSLEKTKLQGAQQKYDVLTNAYDTISEQKESLEGKLKTTIEEHSRIIQSKEAQLDQKNNQIQELQQQLKTLENKQKEALQLAEQKFLEDKNQLNIQIQELKKLKNSLERAKNALEEKKNALETFLKKLQKDNESKDTKITELTKSNTELETQQLSLQAKTQQNNHLIAKLDEEQKNNIELSKQNEKYNQEIQTLKTQINRLESFKLELETKLENITTENTRLNNSSMQKTKDFDLPYKKEKSLAEADSKTIKGILMGIGGTATFGFLAYLLFVLKGGHLAWA